ncbi:MAG TPA: amino acid adenylation domain-containing protein, partial [Longimicrobiaceae bacterium]|nr:amino acid adenylation domain-containing protein [Longimicrobiaceae bacterium]
MTDLLLQLAKLSPEKRRLLEQRLRAGPPPTAELRPRARGGEPLPLSFAQQRLWFVDRLDPGRSTYNMSYPLRVSGELDLPALRRALDEVVRRHESLRTRFPVRDGEPEQVVEPASRARLPLVDLGGLGERAREAELRRLAAEEAGRPFDLAAGPLLRTTAVRLGAADAAVFFTMHHIVSDGWSIGILVREVSALYAAHSRGEALRLPDLPLQYADYAAWQREWLTGAVLQEQVGFWRERLAGAPALLELPTDRPRPPVAGDGGAIHGFAAGAATTAALDALARREGATRFMVLLAAWQLLLARYAGTDDVVVGTPIAGRTWAETEGLIGLFVNTLVLRARVPRTITFRELLHHVRETTLGAFEHQEFPFEKLVQELGMERSQAYSPVFQVMFALQNAGGGELELDGAGVEGVDAGESAPARFDLSLSLFGADAEIRGELTYRVELWERASIARLLRHYGRVLEQVVQAPERLLRDVSLLADGERAQVLEGWNATSAAYPRGRCVHELFAEQAACTPGAPAVVFRGETLTYAELDRRSNRLAHALRRRGVGPEVRVALCLERGVEQVVAVLGVLRAGGAYVPLDPAHPPERLALLLSDAGAPVVLTQPHLRERLPSTGAQVLCLDGDLPGPGVGDAAPPESGAVPENLAYVVYTSGSTGRPKGVMVTHRSVVNLAAALREAVYGRRGADAAPRVSMNGPLTFDTSVKQWVQLLSGAALYPVPDEVRYDGGTMGEWLRESRVEVLDCTPAQLRVLIADGLLEQAGAAPTDVLVAGEAIDPATWRRLGEDAGRRYYNLYGPTECTVDAVLSPVEASRPVPVIGRPIGNVRAYVLDAGLDPVPVGVPGELYVGGEGVARGYLGRADLTAAAFLPDPFGGRSGARLYGTGDRVRWLPSGELEYLGRTDFQVKVRGFRIEPGEVEAALQAHPSVREAVVVVREDTPGEKRLAAYVVGGDVAAAALRAHLGARLPEYMVPSDFVVLESLPLTPNGKVDRRALPAPEAASGDAFVAPRTPTEEIVSGIWAEVLGAARVGAADDFFALGGHSLLVARVVSRVRRSLGVELPLRAVFDASTVAGLAARIDALLREEREGPVPPLAPVRRDLPLPLSFAQQRLWLIHQLDPASPAYNIGYPLLVRGRLDVGALRRALSGVVRRHETLRTRFAEEGGTPVQVVGRAERAAVGVVDLRELPRAAAGDVLRRLAREDALRPFDLARGPLLRATLVRTDAEEWGLLVSMHHIVSDGWSTGVMVRELSELYDACTGGREPRLPVLPVQYADYAAWQRAWLSGDTLEAQLAYWRKALAGAPPVLELPGDHRSGAAPEPLAGTHVFRVPEKTTRALRTLGREEGATQFMVLLAAVQALLSVYSGQEDLVVGTPVANRTRGETEGLIGFFVNTLVLRADLSGTPTFRALLARVRETTLGAFAHQELPFERVVEELQPERSLSRMPFFQVMFTHQESGAGELRLGGVHAEPLEGAEGIAKFDLLVSFTGGEDGLTGALEYAADRFAPATIARMAEHLRVLLEGAAADADRAITAASLLDGAERERVVVEWNDTRTAYPRGSSIPALFAEAAARTPAAVALSFAGDTLTYAELDARSARLAHLLRARGVGPDTPVGLLLERSAELVVGMLAVLRAGGFYVPLDPANPAERLAAMLSETAGPVLLTRGSLRGRIAESAARVLDLQELAALLDGYPAEAPAVEVGPQHLAYVVYTSGSTGKPKGIAVPHRGVVRLVKESDYVRLTPGDRVAQASNASFDAATFEVWGALLNGAALVGVDRDTMLAPSRFVSFLREERITTLFLTTALFNQVVREVPEGFRTLTHLLFGGEAVDPSAVRACLAAGAPERLLHVYGPTESTTFASWHRVERVGEDAGTVPIGRGIANTTLYVLDRGGEPVPEGVPGELYVGGDGVARGYLNRPGLTAERFLPDPFGGEPGARLYRTGDRVRWTEGEIEFLGRVDFQVKIRGFRIEPGEIEGVLLGHPGVRDAVVLAPEDGGERRLVGYVVPREGAELGAEGVREYLRQRLPEYMVPASVVVLDAMPLNANGKVDRRALPKPERASGEGYVPPRTPVQEVLAGIWADVLGAGRVGAADDFFALGGHSLLATRVVSRVREAFGVELPLRALFEAPTPAALAERVEALRG